VALLGDERPEAGPEDENPSLHRGDDTDPLI
jgi:hypothetical protein